MNSELEPYDDIDEMTVTRAEYNALMDIRGLEQDAHFLVMTARLQPDGGWELKGKSKAFDALASDLSDEISYELSGNLRQLRKLYRRITGHPFDS